jgi:hypothetical protein
LRSGSRAFFPASPRASRRTCSEIAIVSDRSDPQLGHLDGLNLSRAWCMRHIAAALPQGDPARAVLEESGHTHAIDALATCRDRSLRRRALARIVRRLFADRTEVAMSKTRLFEAVRPRPHETKKILAGQAELLKVRNDQGRNLLHPACAPMRRNWASRAAAAQEWCILLDSGLEFEEEGGAGPDPVQADLVRDREGRNVDVVKYLLSARREPTGLYAAGLVGGHRHSQHPDRRRAPRRKSFVGVTPFLACWDWKKFKAAKALRAHKVPRQCPEIKNAAGPR